MLNIYKIVLLVGVFALFLSGVVSSGEEKELIEVVATGIGQDSDSALKNALRAAIEQAVGTLVDSETMAQNDEVMNDKILSYSAGFVESHKIIGEPKTRDGLVTIKIQAQVKRTQLTEKLKAANIHIKEIDGGSLFGEVVSKIDQKQSGSEMLKAVFKEFPESVLKANMVGKPKYDDTKKVINIDVEVAVDLQAYKNITNKIATVLTQLATNEEELTLQSNPAAGYPVSLQVFLGSNNNLVDDIFRKSLIIVCKKMNEARTSGIWTSYDIDQTILQDICDFIKRPIMKVSIVDAEGDAIVSGAFDIPVPMTLTHKNYGGKVGGIAIHPVLSERISSVIGPGTVSSTYTLNFDASPNEIKQMKNVVCKIERGK